MTQYRFVNSPAVHATFLLLSTVASSTSAHAVTYTAMLLHPAAGFNETYGLGGSGSDQVGWGYATDGHQRALLWSGSSANFVDLTPPDFTDAVAFTGTGVFQVGTGHGPATGGEQHALMWHGTAASVVDLHPPGMNYSVAEGASGTSQVGYGSTTSTTANAHALLWHGTAASVVDLHSSGFSRSQAFAATDTTQVGWGFVTPSGNPHAVLWQGSAASVVDLNPTGIDRSVARGAWGNQQVGSGSGPATGGNNHALLWGGSAASVVDLNSMGLSTSETWDVRDGTQVGRGSGSLTGSKDHALLWRGTANSVVDLHPFLASTGISFTESNASYIAAEGTIVGTAIRSNGLRHAVMWTPVTEVPGDYNNNGVVDAADYVLWRKHDGESYQLLNEVSGVTPGQVTQDDYHAWRSRFGNQSGSGNGALGQSAIPEPYTAILLMGGLTVASIARACRRR